MAYLQSHRGDYLSGYQGGLGSFLGGALRGAINIGRRALGTMTPAGRIATGLAVATPVVRSLPGIPMPGGRQMHPAAFLPGGQPLITGPQAPGDVVPKGYRLNKSSYWLKDGTFVPAGTRYVKIRRRNMANGRALRRSIGRVQGFNRLVKSSRKSLRTLAKI